MTRRFDLKVSFCTPARRRLFRLASVAFVTLALLTSAVADEISRPRIGLVLGGGGARGAAHIGVIQQLEEMRVPVDFVVGTSMGSIVGGLYAAGYSPDEMAEIVEQADWATIMSDDPPRDQLWFRRRQDDRIFQVDLELGWRDGAPTLPSGLILGSNIDAFLERLLLPVAAVDDFDALPIAFRCVAIDIADGSAVVFKNGSLPKAIRASMSLPGIFAPVEHEGRILVDGGFVDNLPVDVARDLGADILIVVDVATPIADPTTRHSLVGVYDQVIRVLMDKNRQLSADSLTDSDISIVPVLDDFGSLEFGRSAEAIDGGKVAARKHHEALAALAVDEATWNAWLDKQRRPEFEAPTIRHLTVDAQTRLSERVISEFSELRSGGLLDPITLTRTREKLAGLKIFQRTEIEVEDVPGSENEVDVIVRPIEKTWGPNYLRFGLGMSSDLQGGGEFDLGIQHTLTPINAYGGEWRNEAQFGTRTRLFTEFYQPFDAALRWFVAPSIEYEQDILPIIIAREKIAEVNIRATDFGLALGRNLGSWGEARIRYGWVTGKVRPEVQIPGLLPSSISIDQGELTMSLALDTLDKITFSRRGFVGEVDWKYVKQPFASNESKSVVYAQVGSPMTFGALTVFPTIEGGLTLNGDSLIGGEFNLGGFQRLSGLQPREFSGNNMALGIVRSYYQLSERASQFGLATYIGASLELGGVWQDRTGFNRDDLLLAGSVYVGAESFIGPIYLALGFTEGGDRAIYVFVGPTF